MVPKTTPKARSEGERKTRTPALITSLNALVSGQRLHVCLEVVTDFLERPQGWNKTLLHCLGV